MINMNKNIILCLIIFYENMDLLKEDDTLI
jgi:hypothetical protein